MKANESSNTTGRAIILHANDNVATALEDLQKGAIVSFPDRNLSVTLRDDIKFGHKLAVKDIEEGNIILKYGVAIGKLTRSVCVGDHVHVHNLVTLQKKGDAI